MNKHYRIYITTCKTAFDSKTYLYVADDDGKVVYYDWFDSRYSHNYSLMMNLISDIIFESGWTRIRQGLANRIILNNDDILVLEGVNGWKYEEPIVYSTDFYTIC